MWDKEQCNHLPESVISNLWYIQQGWGICIRYSYSNTVFGCIRICIRMIVIKHQSIRIRIRILGKSISILWIIWRMILNPSSEITVIVLPSYKSTFLFGRRVWYRFTSCGRLAATGVRTSVAAREWKVTWYSTITQAYCWIYSLPFCCPLESLDITCIIMLRSAVSPEGYNVNCAVSHAQNTGISHKFVTLF